MSTSRAFCFEEDESVVKLSLVGEDLLVDIMTESDEDDVPSIDLNASWEMYTVVSTLFFFLLTWLRLVLQRLRLPWCL